MTRQGFIDFNIRFSTENSRKASSYAMAIRIRWEDKAHTKERLNPCNGICLSALYDKAFDQGLITISPDDYSVILSSALRENETKAYYDKHFGCIDGQKLTMPTEYLPNRDFLAYHRDKVFVGI